MLFDASTVNQGAMQTKKKVKKTYPSKLRVDRIPFEQWATDFLATPGIFEEIQKGKLAFLKSGYPLLRAQLSANTMDRMRVAVFDTLGVTFAGAIHKAELVSRCLVEFETRFGVDAAVAPHVADFGLVIDTVEGSVVAGEVILLEHNSIDTMAGPCVEEIGLMSGWVKRDLELVKVMVGCENIDWAELYLHKKVVLKDAKE